MSNIFSLGAKRWTPIMSEGPKVRRSARRIVTGHDTRGRAVILADEPPPRTMYISGANVELFELWNTNASPAPILASESEPTDRPIQLAPRKHGTVIRFTDFHPGGLQAGEDSARELAVKSFAAAGDASNSTWKADAAHPMMHRTQTIDYGIVLEGEIYLVLDDSETLLKPGDVVIQRGTNHAWDNRSAAVCRMAFVLIDGVFAPEVAALLATPV
jgi:mannose-6-phosphate isomerase-like protein (cupin superfamily)